MFERMLDKSFMPSPEAMAAYCGDGGEGFRKINVWLTENYTTEQSVTFPYGNSYGWCISHHIKRKLVCNVFPEAGAFTVMLRLPNADFDRILENVSEHAKETINSKFPCGEGGWVHFRVMCPEHVNDAMCMLTQKFAKGKK